jgi:hypothetical protein
VLKALFSKSVLTNSFPFANTNWDDDEMREVIDWLCIRITLTDRKHKTVKLIKISFHISLSVNLLELVGLNYAREIGLSAFANSMSALYMLFLLLRAFEKYLGHNRQRRLNSNERDKFPCHFSIAFKAFIPKSEYTYVNLADLMCGICCVRRSGAGQIDGNGLSHGVLCST